MKKAILCIMATLFALCTTVVAQTTFKTEQSILSIAKAKMVKPVYTIQESITAYYRAFYKIANATSDAEIQEAYNSVQGIPTPLDEQFGGVDLDEEYKQFFEQLYGNRTDGCFTVSVTCFAQYVHCIRYTTNPNLGPHELPGQWSILCDRAYMHCYTSQGCTPPTPPPPIN